MAHFMSGRMRQNQVQRGPTWSELGRQMTMGDDAPAPAFEDPPGRWVARANGERYFLPAQPDPEPEPQQPQIAAPAGTWVTQADGARVFVPSAPPPAGPAAAAPTGAGSPGSRATARGSRGMGSRPGDTRPTRPAPGSARTSAGSTVIRNPNAVRVVAPPGWEPFAKRLVVACIAAHAMMEFAEWSECPSCQDWSYNGAMWAIMVILADSAAVFLGFSAVVMLRSAWLEHGKPWCESLRRKRVGIAEGLNARLGDFAEGDVETFESDRSVEPVSVAVSTSQAILDGTFVVEGAAVAHPTVDGGSLGWGRTDAGMDSDGQTPDGFVEDV